MTYQPVHAIRVRLWGSDVGALARDPATGFYVFQYTNAWRAEAVEFAPLTMPTSGEFYVFTSLPRATFFGLPSAIADALPDAFGNALVENYLARQGIGRDTITPLDRLAYHGKRGMGAMEFRPMRGPSNQRASAVEMGRLVDAARAAVHGRLGPDDADLGPLIRVGTSAGGARAKAVVAWNPITGDLRSGQVPPPPGFEHWLIKLDGIGPDAEMGSGGEFGRIEHAYAMMARAAGIDMAPTRLLEEGGRAHFMTQRFDRTPDGDKVHMQSLCGMVGLDFNAIGTSSYEQLLQACDALALGADARHQVLRRAAFNVACANCDDHTKNHAFLMDPTGAWSLAPAYDVTHAYNPQGRWTYQHLMSINGQFTGIGRADLRAMADRFAIPHTDAAISDVVTAVEAWPDFASQAGLSPATARRVSRDFINLASQ